MDCARVDELLADYLAGLLPEPQTTLIEAHLAACPTCQALFLPDDAELEALLATDWYAAEPSFDLVPQIMSTLPNPRRHSWARVAAILAAWSCYFALWLIGAVTLWYPKVFLGLCRLVLNTRESLHFLLSIARSLWNALSLLTPTPLGIGLLLVLLVTLSYCLYRLEKEEDLI